MVVKRGGVDTWELPSTSVDVVADVKDLFEPIDRIDDFEGEVLRMSVFEIDANNLLSTLGVGTTSSEGKSIGGLRGLSSMGGILGMSDKRVDIRLLLSPELKKGALGTIVPLPVEPTEPRLKAKGLDWGRVKTSISNLSASGLYMLPESLGVAEGSAPLSSGRKGSSMLERTS